MTDKAYVLAFDTANETVAVGLGRLDAEARAVELVAQLQVAAHRASNTQLLPRVDELLQEAGVPRAAIACVAVGRGPGSFTGVRIAMATAKGIASALEGPLVGLSSLDAVAWNAWAQGVRGDVLVAADAMRREVYPVRYRLDDAGAQRLGEDVVVKAVDFAEGLVGDESRHSAHTGSLHSGPSGASGRDDVVVDSAGVSEAPSPSVISTGVSEANGVERSRAGRRPEGESVPRLQIIGDALAKYADLFAPAGELLSEALWAPTGRGLLLALQAAWRAGECDPFDAARHNPAFVLPVYTRLSDAEEAERKKNAQVEPVLAPRDSKHVTMHDTAVLNARAGSDGIAYKPLRAARAADVAAMEAATMGTDAWNEALVTDDLGRPNRVWWAACQADPSMPLPDHARLLGYAGGLVVDGDVQILKVAVDPEFRRRGIAQELVARVADDARNLNARTSSLEVRASNTGAQAFYERLGYRSLGKRPRYYSDGEDAVIMKAETLPQSAKDVAGMDLQRVISTEANEVSAVEKSSQTPKHILDREDLSTPGLRPSGRDDVGEGRLRPSGRDDELLAPRPLILAIESSCDETAAAVVDGEGALLSDVIASQVDFHARFGGVVPEIASRKHIEAICGVCDAALEEAAGGLRWKDLSAVAVTYAPGLVGALVVGVAFAKGAAWALEAPFIRVNHLEGHLYANKIGAEDFAPPAVVSLVSGGNTLLVYMKDWGCYEVLGATIDDAVGEAFDKVAKALGLGYPGGPVISRFAAKGNPEAIDFPRAMMRSGNLDFSLSGLKTAVVNYVNQQRQAGNAVPVADVCASFQQAVVDVQIAKARMALEQTGAPTFCLGGGVAANPVLRQAYEKLCAEMGVRMLLPPLSSCGDNAGMIALVALDRYEAGNFSPLDSDAAAQANLEEPY